MLMYSNIWRKVPTTVELGYSYCACVKMDGSFNPAWNSTRISFRTEKHRKIIRWPCINRICRCTKRRVRLKSFSKKREKKQRKVSKLKKTMKKYEFMLFQVKSVNQFNKKNYFVWQAFHSKVHIPSRLSPVNNWISLTLTHYWIMYIILHTWFSSFSKLTLSAFARWDL